MILKNVFFIIFGTFVFAGFADNAASSSQQAAPLPLTVSIPADSQKFDAPLIPVAGTTVPGAQVWVLGIQILVDSNGNFNGKIPIPDEDAGLELPITVKLNGRSHVIARHIRYAAAVRVRVISPAEGETVGDTMVSFQGDVTPCNAALSVNNKKIIVKKDGSFSGSIAVNGPEPEIKLEFIAVAGAKQSKMQRTVIYKRASDGVGPVISPAFLPAIARQDKLYFSVIDRTPGEEITFFREMDGAKESEVGQGNGQFILPVEEGIHSYTIYAQNKAKNQTKHISGEIKFLSRPFTIKVNHPLPGEVLSWPSSREESGRNYTVSFSIGNLPDDNPKLLKEVTVTNSTNGATALERNPVGIDFNLDLEVERTGQNVFTIAVHDINDRIITTQASIRIR
ncbi:MAG: hypothetical protein PHC61_00010 [Chitinivibrionales bacterium]|nr:hypothetical protein [Chitinivibrionales bacterium]